MSLQSRAASYHNALESLTVKHTQLQSAHATTLRTLDTLQQQTAQHSSTVQQLQHAVEQLRAEKRSLKQSHSQYRSDVCQQVEQLKRDFIATQHNYDATLSFYKRGGEGRQHELDAVKRKLAAYKQQMGHEHTAAETIDEDGDETESATETTKAEEEEKQSATDDAEDVIDFRAEVEIRRAGGAAIDSRIKQLTLGKESVVGLQSSSGSKQFGGSLATDSCSDCEQEI